MAVITPLDNIAMTVSVTPGTGTITLNAALTSDNLGAFRAFPSTADGTYVDVAFYDGSAWGIEYGCLYTNSGTTLARGTIGPSSTGSQLSLTSSAIVVVVNSAKSVSNGVSVWK